MYTIEGIHVPRSKTISDMIDQILALQKEIVQGRAVTLPSMDKYLLWFSRLLAENLVKRDSLAADRAALDVRMAAALEEGKMNAWKRKDKKESASVQTIQKEIADLDGKMEALVKEAAPAQKAVDVFKRWEKEDEDILQWKNGGPEPEHIRLREEANLAYLRSGCVSLRFDPSHPVWSPHKEETAEESWINMTPESYLETLKPKPKPVGEVVEEIPSGFGGTPAWMLRFRKRTV
jgi:hypothetical protein